jgi:hypothetical protein
LFEWQLLPAECRSGPGKITQVFLLPSSRPGRMMVFNVPLARGIASHNKRILPHTRTIARQRAVRDVTKRE